MRLFPNLCCIILGATSIDVFWYCTISGQKTEPLQAGAKRGWKPAAAQETVTNYFPEVLTWVE